MEATAQPVATQVVADPEPEAAPQYAVEEELGATGTQVVAREKVEMVMAGPQGGEVEGEQRVVLLVQGRSSTSWGDHPGHPGHPGLIPRRAKLYF